MPHLLADHGGRLGAEHSALADLVDLDLVERQLEFSVFVVIHRILDNAANGLCRRGGGVPLPDDTRGDHLASSQTLIARTLCLAVVEQVWSTHLR